MGKLFEDREHLKKVIQYHVVSGSHPYDDITDETSLATMEGSELRLNKFQKTDGHPEFPSFVTVNGKLVVGSIAADNGVIHIISDLLYPLPVVSIAEILSLDPRFSSLEKAVKTAGMEETLATGGPFTLFAPTKKAFEGMEDNEDPVKSKELIQRHLVSGSYFAARLVNHTIAAESGESLKVTLEKGENSFLTVLRGYESGGDGAGCSRNQRSRPRHQHHPLMSPEAARTYCSS